MRSRENIAVELYTYSSIHVHVVLNPGLCASVYAQREALRAVCYIKEVYAVTWCALCNKYVCVCVWWFAHMFVCYICVCVCV